MQELYFLLLLLASSGNSILIVILLKRTVNSPILSTFVVLLLLINFWSIPQLLLITYEFNENLFIAIDKISAIGYVFIPVAMSLFALAYTNNLIAARSLYFLLGVYAPSLIFLYFAWNTNLIESRIYSEIIKTNWGNAVPTGSLFPIMVIWFELIAFYSIFIIWQMSKKTLDTLKKKQSILLMIAMAIPILFGSITNGVLPAFHISVFPIAIPLTTVTALITTYAIYKYGLFELSTINVLSSIGNGVITINTQKQIVLINGVARDLLGLRNEKVYEKTLENVITIKSAAHNTPNHVKKPIAYVLNTGKQIKSHDFFIRSKFRKTFSAECTISPLLQNGSVIGVTIIFRDNSHEKAIEKSKNEFISIASHELKTPLTSVIAFSQLLEKDIIKKGDQQNLYIIHSVNEQLGKMKILIEDLLNVSRIESGMFTLNKKAHSLENLVLKTVKDIQYGTDSHKLIVVGSTKRKLIFDIDRIYQVLVNLVSNAVKYSPHAKHVYIFIEESEKEVIIRVKDSGIGIAKKDQQKIFERFYRSNKFHQKSMVGFGLGLYICAEIIRNHKGKLWVESKQNKGSVFSFSLPYSGD